MRFWERPASGHHYFSVEASDLKPINEDWAKLCKINCIANGEKSKNLAGLARLVRFA